MVCCDSKPGLILRDLQKDSLNYFFEAANNDSLTPSVRKLYTKKALDIISQGSNDSMRRVNYFKVANRYFNINDLENYKKICEKVKIASEKAKDSNSIAKAYSYLADYYAAKFNSEKAYRYYFNAQKIYINLGKTTKAAKCLLNKSVLQFNEKDYVGSEKSAFEALKYIKTTNETDLLYDSYNLLGILANELNEFSKALEYHNKALAVIETDNPLSNELRFASLHNIGLTYQNGKDDEKAIEFFYKAIKSDPNLHSKSKDYATLIDNLGYSKLRLKAFNDLPILFYKSLHIADSLNSLPNKLSSELHLAEYYLSKSDTVKATEFGKNVYQEAKSNNLDKYMLLSLKRLTESDPKNAGNYSKKYIKINDSLQLAERQTRNKLGRIEYETDQLATEKNQLVEQRKTLIYIVLGIILIAGFIFIIRFQAEKNRELRAMQEQQAANEEIYQLMITQQDKQEETRQAEKKRIAQEIHDGVLGKLFGTRMHLGLLNDRDGKEAHTERVTYIDELKTLEQELREISHDLNSEKQAVANNFVQMVMNFIETQRTVCKAAITINMENKIDWAAVDSVAKINLYRILQEAFQNINKHAQASDVSVDFTQQDGNILLTVYDDGVGFNYFKKKKGIGMLNMHSRITGSGGTMAVVTAPGVGTKLEFALPVTISKKLLKVL
ncbi:sensor histidine kinase [Flavobacterium pallidum]|uniref:histidine kinase n=2 Tax=Flavobacterium pallidum TaxID=2172098 RepID=A0A2S1SF08_9FLAO|nr:sensor histidine kinase [Flavobacterium pallidum]